MRLVVDEQGSGYRLDTFVSSRVPDVSRNFIKRLILAGWIHVNGNATKPGYILKPGDLIDITLPDYSTGAINLTPRQISLNILFEDDHIIVVDKQPGLVVHPGAGREEETLVHGLLAHCGKLASVGAPERPGIVHRLDEHTSGLIVVAKTDPAYWGLAAQFQNRTVEKYYVAFVWGNPKDDHGIVDAPIGRHPKNRKKMAVIPYGRPSVSQWQIDKVWPGFAKLLVKILTGRTHQIRVHLAHIHHPILGDEIYGRHSRRLKSVQNKEIRKYLKLIARQMLHAKTLKFRHPVTNELLSFSSDLPDDMRDLEKTFDRIFKPTVQLN